MRIVVVNKPSKYNNRINCYELNSNDKEFMPEGFWSHQLCATNRTYTASAYWVINAYADTLCRQMKLRKSHCGIYSSRFS